MPPSVAFPRDGAAETPAAPPPARSRRVAALTFAAGAAALGVGAYEVQVDALSTHSAAGATVAVAWAFVVAGLVAWLCRPQNRLGPLMLAAGTALLARQFRYSQDAFVFTVFFLLGDLGYALVGHSILAYPSGRVLGRGPRLFVLTGYATVLVFPLVALLFHDERDGLVAMGRLPRRSLLFVGDRAELAQIAQKTEVVVFFGVLATLFIGVIARRLVRATPRARRILAPLLLAAVALGLRAVFENVHTFADQQPLAYPYLFWWQIAALIALPLALLAGILRAKLARANVGDLVLELARRPPTPGGLRDALAHALADPSVEIYFWLPERQAYVDAAGAPARLPRETAQRTVTRLADEGEPIAAVVHDPSLLEEPELVEAAGTAARVALENARLHAETRAQLQQVRDVRRRIASVADDERRRIERNLHDGAQQRLLALALQLRSAQRTHTDPEIERLLAASVQELQSTIEELRTLARGLHPPLLTERGLAPALAALVARVPVDVSVDAPAERLPADVEATTYFVACEALNNVVKHARAQSASIAVSRDGDRARVEIVDDGVGGARAGAGSGLEGMRERAEMLGGTLRIASGAGGTTVTAELPCVS